jgi:hypothetical protein
VRSSELKREPFAAASTSWGDRFRAATRSYEPIGEQVRDAGGCRTERHSRASVRGSDYPYGSA